MPIELLVEFVGAAVEFEGGGVAVAFVIVWLSIELLLEFVGRMVGTWLPVELVRFNVGVATVWLIVLVGAASCAVVVETLVVKLSGAA